MSRHLSSFHEVETSPDGRYVRFDEQLGTGAYKAVYLAYDTETGKEVAWNIVQMKKLPIAEKKRIQMETSILSRLHHPHVINFYAVWQNEEDEQVNFATEIVTSGTLKQYTSRLKHVKVKVIKKWCRQILSALIYLHSHSPPIIHRDLKCDNIFINGSTGEVRIGDFGLSVARHATHVESVLGTPEFMAPELYDEKYSESVDVYAFGMCCLEMCSKEYPYQECSNAAQIWKKVSQGQKPEVLTRVNDTALRSFIECCLLPADQRLSAKELLQHPFLAFKRSDPYRDGMLVVVDAKGGVVVGKGAAKGDGEEERVLREVEREGRRKEEEEERRMREVIAAQHRHDSRTALRPQPIDTSTESSHTPPQQSPPSHPTYLSPTASSSPSPTLKRDMSMPSRLPSMLIPQQPSTAPPLALSPSHQSLAMPPAHPSISTRISAFPPPLASPQSAPLDTSHPGAVTSVHVDVEPSQHPHLTSVTLHIHFAVEKRKKQIRFDYNLRDDTSVSLASEMVKALNLGEQERMIIVISGALEEGIDPYRRGYFEGIREGGDRRGVSGTMPPLHHYPTMPFSHEHSMVPQHSSGAPHFNAHPGQSPYPHPHPHTARHATAHHRHYPSTSAVPYPPPNRQSNPPLSSQPRPPSLHTGPMSHMNGSQASRQGAAFDRSRYQSLPQGFNFPHPSQSFASVKTGGTTPAGGQSYAPLSTPPTGQGGAGGQGGRMPVLREVNTVPRATGVAAGGGGVGGHSGMSPASSSPQGPVLSSRRSSMPLQPPPSASLASLALSSPLVSSPPASSSPTSASSPPVGHFNSTAPPSLGARTSSGVSYTAGWMAFYRSLPVAVLKDQVREKQGPDALDGAIERNDLVELLMACTPINEPPPPVMAGKKSSTEDKGKDSQPSSRHNSHNDTGLSTSPPALSPRLPPPLSDPLPSHSPLPVHSPPVRPSPVAAVDEWANLAFDVVGGAKSNSEESKEIPRRTSSGSTFRDLDPLFSSSDAPTGSRLTQPAPLSSPSSTSSASSLYDLASLSPSQPFPSPPAGGEHGMGAVSGRSTVASSAFFSDLLAPMGGGEDGGDAAGAHHRKGGGRNSLMETASIDMLTELVLGKGRGGTATRWRPEEKELDRVQEDGEGSKAN